MIWITADYHFNHTNIIKYCHRPFSSVTEMNETIIENHNRIVENNDMVFFLGDFSLDDSVDQFLPQMNGNWIFIRGNHDAGCKYFTTRSLAILYRNYSILLLHDPDYVKKEQFKNKKYDVYLCGHVHDNWKSRIIHNKLFYNIGVDTYNFYPTKIDRIIEEHKEKNA